MASFRTEINIAPTSFKLNLNSRVLTIGSCFSEVMGNKLVHYKVNSLVNPFGTIFNPLSVFKLIAASLNPHQEFRGELVQRDGFWFSYDLHSSFSGHTREELLEKVQKALIQTNLHLRKADLLIITFGTAVGYVHQETKQVVANCHKIPQQYFEKQVINLTDILESFAFVFQLLNYFNPDLQILVTVSPVRHIKETLELNSLSKALLRVACHKLSEQYSNVSYFPAFEIVMDDLRDYRFYKSDMLHPNEVAENYIWNKFKDAYFDDAFQQFTPEWDKIQQALQHKPFHPESAAHQSFLRKTLAKLENFQNHFNCDSEIAEVKRQIK